MPAEKNSAAVVAEPAVQEEELENKAGAKKAGKVSTRRGRPPLMPEIFVEVGSKQFNITDIVDRAKADYRTTHKVGVQSCKIYVKPEEAAAYYVVNKVEGKLDL